MGLRISIGHFSTAVAVFSVVIHWVESSFEFFVIFKHHHGFVWCQQRFVEGIPPVDRQTGARDLDESVDIVKHGQFGREYLRQNNLDHNLSGLDQLLLEFFHGDWISLSSKRSKNQANLFSVPGTLHGIGSHLNHLLLCIVFPGELSRVRIVSESRDRRVVNHCALQMEPTVTNVHHGVVLIRVQAGRRAS
ncbi:hypothetical protein OGAPHI_003779 [Ogataea philodendri]|uniref:Uncharacterized protein n=1 Tax=Ogataea philodendri TaxID=1378263 RepID=A0A9P8P5T1_9ASCO|nr:uncharacterized protein OGAPHI_003779 [Ogataea philodendri]KAH3665591.1 hypothetical protein OGAPHI_003779 [Ogataea philodendri]